MAQGIGDTTDNPKTQKIPKKCLDHKRILSFGSARFASFLARAVDCRYGFLILHFRSAGCSTILLLDLFGSFRFVSVVTYRGWVSSPGREADMSIGLENFTLHRKGCSHSTQRTGLI
jgi:hypothetical protein